MADINYPGTPQSRANLTDGPQKTNRPSGDIAQNREPEPTWDLIELLFFAYRDFVAEADHVLEALAFGRAHHRVLHFINRNPGINVADLLDILRITKQSLGRVLTALVDQNYVEQRAGPRDRRQRLLHVTSKGQALALQLAHLQTMRIERALAEFAPGERAAARAFLVAMVDAEDRDHVTKLIAKGYSRRSPQD